MFCSPRSHNAAAEQGLTQQLTREPKAETMLRATGQGASGSGGIAGPVSGKDGGLCRFPTPLPGTAPARAAPPSRLRAFHGEKAPALRGHARGELPNSARQSRRDGRDDGASLASSSTPSQHHLQNVPARPGLGWVSLLLQEDHTDPITPPQFWI